MSESPKQIETKKYQDDPVSTWTTLVELLVDKDFKGCRVPAPFSYRTAEWKYNNWNPDHGDVLVATYPKSGTYLMDFIGKIIIKEK